MDRNKKDKDHFIQLDAEKLKHIEAQRKRFLTETMQRAADIDSMRCPLCNRQLEEKIVNDISITICTKCRGIWLETESFAKMLRLSDDMVDTFLDGIKE